MRARTSAEGSWVAEGAEVASLDPLAAAELGLPSFVWMQPARGRSLVGWGEAQVLTAERRADALALLEELAGASIDWRGVPAFPGPWMGGMSFALAPVREERWQSFGMARWVLPEMLAWQEGGVTRLAAFARDADEARARLASAKAAWREVPRASDAQQLAPSFESSRAEWDARVTRALGALERGELLKVVLARAIRLQVNAPFELAQVVSRLRATYPHCTTFLVRVEDGTAFAGATPETLCTVRGRQLVTEALAGTAPPADGEWLLRSDKNLREHQAVVDGIREALSPLSESMALPGKPELLALRNVLHLRTAVTAHLRDGIGLADVVSALYPTPAVGGTPRGAALEFLAEHEGFDRGWYAGPVGLLGQGRADLKVALRCARVHGNEARLYVGAGLVKGSTAESEWKETEVKSRAMRTALLGDSDA